MAAAALGGFGTPLLVQAGIDPGKPSPLHLRCPNSQDLISTSKTEPGWGRGPGSWVGGRAKEGLSHRRDRSLGQNQQGSEFPVLGWGRLARVEPALPRGLPRVTVMKREEPGTQGKHLGFSRHQLPCRVPESGGGCSGAEQHT